MGDTRIEWTDKTWNPVRGCSMAKESETGGCLNCYAARMAARNLPEMKSPTTGAPFAVMRASGPRWTGDVELIEHLLDKPVSWKRPQRVFVNSMSDLFHEDLPFRDVARVFDAMHAAPWHTYQILTKRPERALEFFKDRTAGPNVWLGTSVENQATADLRVPFLIQIPLAVRFISYEPALGDVDFTPWLGKLDWIITGGESGPGARMFDLNWARHLREQCSEGGTACFIKQLGGRPFDGQPLRLRDKKGGDWTEWPEDLRVRQFPSLTN